MTDSIACPTCGEPGRHTAIMLNGREACTAPTEATEDAEQPNEPTSYARMINALTDALNPQREWDKVREAFDTFAHGQRKLLREANSARIKYEAELQEQTADLRNRLIELDRKVMFLEEIDQYSANSDDFKDGVKYAAAEIRRGLERFRENRDGE